MSTALQFTSVFDPTKPPQKLKAGGVGGQTKKFEDITPMGNKKFNIDDMKNLKGTEPRFNIRDMQERAPKKTTEDKMNMLANKALEARGIKTEAIKDLETPPPVSVAEGPKNLYESLDIPKPVGPGGRYDDSFLDLLDNNFFKTPNIMPGMIMKDKFINMPRLPDGINRSEDLQMQMIMRAQNDDSGINRIVNDSPIAQLRMMDYNGIV